MIINFAALLQTDRRVRMQRFARELSLGQLSPLETGRLVPHQWKSLLNNLDQMFTCHFNLCKTRWLTDKYGGTQPTKWCTSMGSRYRQYHRSFPSPSSSQDSVLERHLYCVSINRPCEVNLYSIFSGGKSVFYIFEW